MAQRQLKGKGGELVEEKSGEPLDRISDESFEETGETEDELSEERTGESEDELTEPMVQTDPFVLEIKLSPKDLWKFSMYFSYRGLKGLFNVIFTLAAIYLLAADWNTVAVWYRALLILCALMFTVINPSLLYLKAAKQSRSPAIKNPITLSLSREGIVASQAGKCLELTWDQVALVERAGSLIILYMDRVHAYLLPDSFMGEQKEALCALMREMLPGERRKHI